jgi:hypothetical protein
MIGAGRSVQEEMAIFSRSTRLASQGFAADADGWQTNLAAAAGGEPSRLSLSKEELALIEQHRKCQALVSDQALKAVRQVKAAEQTVAYGLHQTSESAGERGSYKEVAGACGEVVGAVATGWEAAVPLEEQSNKLLPA